MEEWLNEDNLPFTVAVACAAIALVYLAVKQSGPKLLPWQAAGAKFLDKTRQSVKIIRRTQISHDVCRIRFGLPSETPVLGKYRIPFAYRLHTNCIRSHRGGFKMAPRRQNRQM